jgi:tetratricopeptide (TPR) repeat protein
VELIGARFELEALVGAGGMGQIYRARDRLDGSQVAVKLLHDAEDEVRAARFLDEARLLGTLDHPGIVRYVAHGLTRGRTPYLAMEWLEGDNLSARLAGGALSVNEASALVARAAAALGAAHAAGIVHRDVKPSNLILVGGSVARIKVVDFGLACLPAEREEPPGRAGTPRYMAPEQVRGDRELDARVDVFGLGCIFYHCLTGRSAFGGQDEMAVFGRILLEDPTPAHVVSAGIPLDLSLLCARMLAKDAATRPEDGNAVAAELAALARDDTRLVSPARPARRELERRLLAFVLVHCDRPERDREALKAELGACARAHGASLDMFRDRTCISVLAGARSAVDLAAQAARLALALRDRAGGPVAVATGVDVYSTRPTGELIDRAAETLRAAPPGTVRVDQVTADLLQTRLILDGGSVVAQREAPAVRRTLLGRSTPFVGRERETAMLETLLADCFATPAAQAALVVGPPGAGKSRLAEELLALHPEINPLVAFGDPTHTGSPFGLVGSALRRAAGICSGDPPEEQRRKLAARAPDGVDHLAELLAIPGAAAGARDDPLLAGDRMVRAVVDFLAAECARGPTLLVVDDLHWGDRPSARCIDIALRELGDRPLFVLALARPEVHRLFPRLWSDRRTIEVRLGELPRRAAERLVRVVLGEAEPAERVAHIVDHAGGNPFFLEELVRAAAEGRDDALPETVLAMVSARLDGFAPEARRVLRAASVLGESFWLGAVAHILGAAADEVGEWLDILAEREVVVAQADSRFAGEREYAFRHELLRQGAYAAWTDADRARAHLLGGEWLASHGEPDAAVVAEQLERGGANAHAADWYRRGAEQALAANDFAGAVAHAERGLGLGPDAEARVGLASAALEASWWRGDLADALRRGREVMVMSAPGQPSWSTAVWMLAAMAALAGDAARLHGLVGGLLDLDPRAHASTLARTATAVASIGLAAEADRLLGRLEIVEPDADELTRARVEVARALRAGIAGDAETWMRLSRAAVARYLGSGDVRNARFATINWAAALIELGDPAAAVALLRDSLATTRRLGLGLVAGHLWYLGEALARLGQLDEALLAEGEAVSAFAAEGSRPFEAQARATLARILLARGDAAAAEAEAAQACAMLDPAPQARALALATLARARLARGGAAEALEAAEQGMAILDAGGALKEGESLVRLAHADALDACGRAADAAAARAAGRARVLARAEAIREPGRKEQFVAVAENARLLAAGA